MNFRYTFFSVATSFGALFDLGLLLFISVSFTTADIGVQMLVFSSLLLPSQRYDSQLFKRDVYLLAGARALFDIMAVLVIFPYTAHLCENVQAVTDDVSPPDGAAEGFILNTFWGEF